MTVAAGPFQVKMILIIARSLPNLNTDYDRKCWEGLNKQHIMRHGGTNQYESSKIINALLPVASSSFSCHSNLMLLLQVFSEDIVKHNVDVKISAMSHKTFFDIWLGWTMLLKHCSNRQFYISLTSYGFSKRIREWFVGVRDYNLLHSGLFGTKITQAGSNIFLQVLYVCDDE